MIELDGWAVEKGASCAHYLERNRALCGAYVARSSWRLCGTLKGRTCCDGCMRRLGEMVDAVRDAAKKSAPAVTRE